MEDISKTLAIPWQKLQPDRHFLLKQGFSAGLLWLIVAR